MAKAPYIEVHRLKYMLKVAAVNGEFPMRNVALLPYVYGTGTMLTELARRPLTAYLNSDGTVREESVVSPDIAYNGSERPLYWPNKMTERRTSSTAISCFCDSLSQLLRKLHLQAGIEGASTMSGRRTFAVRLSTGQRPVNLRYSKVLLGMKTLRATKMLIDASPVRLGKIAAGVF